ncbi:hypothetical protein IE077_003483 [Cardiosporidium cionae]|uniref:Uncharacterized protein n=1 Tax=Cardiosporidium cionae TaxID=476202 RepID=A0ABQ7J862_9APIC|nr:hypothetical protein IE077_003483 [Cardiosporidium cionae]|eukprot:KAF8820171.1 hypothetical protein IE077_003483 [Cardiosporidium cionae]
MNKKMISVLKNSLVAGASNQDVAIRKKELDWLSQNYWIVATQAAVISGFSFRQLSSPLPNDLPLLFIFPYTLLIVSTLAMSLFVVLTATFTSIMAPGMALRGNCGFESITTAIVTLRGDQERTMRFFVLALMTFVTSSFFVIFIFGQHEIAVIRAETILLFMSISIFIAAWRITVKFYHDRTIASGVVFLESTYNSIGDLDAMTYREPEYLVNHN